MQLVRKNKIVFALFAGLGLFNAFTEWLYPLPDTFLLRPAPVILLAWLAVRNCKSRIGRYFLPGIVAGILAGWVMAMSHYIGPGIAFLAGLGLFLVGHVFYIICFALQWKWRIRRLPAAALVVAIAVTMLVSLEFEKQEMRAPVFAYILVISMMAIFAAFRRSESFAVYAGALFFIVSDCLIAFSVFDGPFPAAAFLIFITYYIAQLLIVVGFVSDEIREENQAPTYAERFV